MLRRETLASLYRVPHSSRAGKVDCAEKSEQVEEDAESGEGGGSDKADEKVEMNKKEEAEDEEEDKPRMVSRMQSIFPLRRIF